MCVTKLRAMIEQSTIINNNNRKELQHSFGLGVNAQLLNSVVLASFHLRPATLGKGSERVYICPFGKRFYHNRETREKSMNIHNSS